VTAASLKDVFEKRSNPPEVLPDTFDAAQHGINKILSGLLSDTTEDETPEGFFSEKWNEEDIKRLKDHLRKHFLDSSTGEDQTSYADLLEIRNDNVARLCSECIERRGGTTIWFMSAIVGILKRLKPHEDPDSYNWSLLNAA
jgi:hypothetical protein